MQKEILFFLTIVKNSFSYCIFRCSLPTAMSISRSEILREKKREVDKLRCTKCPIDAYCHRHCRKDPRITKDCIEVLQVLSFWVFIDFGKKFLRELRNFLIKSKKTQKLKTCRTSQSFVILGSFLQWQWQWASIGHFVFLFPLKFHSLRFSLLLAMSI